MDLDIMKRLVLSYYTGHLRDPELRKAIKDAREWDPVVRGWFTDLEGLGQDEGADNIKNTDALPTVPSRKDQNRRTVLDIEWALGLDNTPLSPPELTPQPVLPVRRVNQVTKVLELLEAPDVVPYGVARVVIEVDGKTTFSGLVPFAEAVEGGLAVRKAELWLSEVGIPVGKSSRAEFFVVPAADDNLGEFPLDDVQALAQKYAGNFAATDAIDLLITRLQHEGRK